MRDLPSQCFDIDNNANNDLSVAAVWHFERQLAHVAQA